MLRHLIASTPLIAMSACMPSTVTELQSSGERVQFETPTPYQETYRNLLSMMRECAYRGILLDTVTVDGELYTDLDAAEIIHEQNNMGDRSVLFQAEISKAGEGATVNAYADGISADHLPYLEAWADGSTECEPDK